MLQKVSCCITSEYNKKNGAFYCILVFVAMQKTWPSFLQNLCYFPIV